MEHVTETLSGILEELRKNRDNEISTTAEVLGQYVTDHSDKQAYKNIDRQVNQLARAWDRMIALLERTVTPAEKIEGSCENFYGD